MNCYSGNLLLSTAAYQPIGVAPGGNFGTISWAGKAATRFQKIIIEPIIERPPRQLTASPIQIGEQTGETEELSTRRRKIEAVCHRCCKVRPSTWQESAPQLVSILSTPPSLATWTVEKATR